MDMPTWKTRVKTHFDAAHKLRDYNGKCANLHGHRWEIEVVYEQHFLGLHTNMTVDFKVVKKQLNELLPDHAYLNDVYQEVNPTAEFLAQKLYTELNARIEELNNPGATLVEVTIWESPECCITYSELDVCDCVAGE
jgi:6-pyruvoyltetrahydropterin/6-carboxytetrahydropterin synthase